MTLMNAIIIKNDISKREMAFKLIYW